MLLRNSEFKQQATYASTYRIAKNALGKDQEGYRAEFLKLILDAERMANKEEPADEDAALLIR